MPGAVRRGWQGGGLHDPAAGLRALAVAVCAALVDLIDDVTGELDARWSPALAGGAAVGPAVGPGWPGPARPAWLARAQPNRTAPGSSAPPDSPPPDSPVPDSPVPAPEADDDAAMDEDHSAAWRLVQRAQAGDGEAFGRLYDRYVDTVFRFVYYRVNDRELAEDFTSETFLRALRRIGTISYQGRDVGAWFVTIARNIVFDHMKSARHRLEVTTADTIERGDHEPGPEDAVLTTLTNERLMAAVAELGNEQRECVLLRFIQGFSVSETAQIMGKNDGAIKALQHRAVRKLAESVAGELR